MDIEQLKNRIAELESGSRALEFSPQQREQALRQAQQYTERFLNDLNERPAFEFPQPRDPAEGEPLNPTEEGIDISEAIHLLERYVDRGGQQIGSPRFFGFIPGGGLYPSAIADFIAAAMNRYTGVEFAAPGLARLERRMIRWLAQEMGMPDETEGDLTSGGSIANLSAIVTAREAHGIRGTEVSRAVAYVSPVTHHSSLKALRIAGCGEAVVREVAVDEHFRLRADSLEDAIRSDRAAGLRPWLVISSAGATDTGSVDPLAAISQITQEQGLWHHIDAAYGGAFALCELGRQRLKGIGSADSLTLDPHKGLFLPFGSGAVLVRDRSKLFDAFHARGAYMQDVDEHASLGAASACDFSPELTRPFRGLRLWLPLRLFGVGAFRAALEEKLLLAQYAHQRLSELPMIDLGPSPDLSILTYRFVPPAGDADEFNARIVREIESDGRIYISSTTLRGRYLDRDYFILRLAILGYNTHRDEVDTAIDVLEATAKALAKT